MNPDSQPVIACDRLTKRYGAQTALDALEWQVPSGTMTALLGQNGAGKTTTLRLLVNLLKPTRGEARVFGRPSQKLRSSDYARLGYVAEGQELPEWMSIAYLLNYLKPMYPTWDEGFCYQLVDLFELPLERKISELSRGMRMKAAFVSSLAYRPELLLLDEPFSGLDTLVREDLIDALLELTAQERWTIVISSHDIDDIERLVDHAAILHHGRLLLHEPVETLQAYREISFRSESALEALEPHWISYQREGERTQWVDTAFDEETTVAALKQACPDLRDLSVRALSLKEAYVALLRSRKESSEPQQRLAS